MLHASHNIGHCLKHGSHHHYWDVWVLVPWVDSKCTKYVECKAYLVGWICTTFEAGLKEMSIVKWGICPQPVEEIWVIQKWRSSQYPSVKRTESTRADSQEGNEVSVLLGSWLGHRLTPRPWSTWWTSIFYLPYLQILSDLGQRMANFF